MHSSSSSGMCRMSRHCPTTKQSLLRSSPGPKVATHAMSTVRTLIGSYGWGGSTSEEQLVQKKRVVKGGLIPKILSICKESKEVDPLCECMDFLALLGMAPTSLEEDHVKEICPVLVDLAGYGDFASGLLLSTDVPHPLQSRSDVPLKSRQYALYTLAKIAEVDDTQAGHVRSCELFQKLLDRLQGEGPELFDGGYFTAGTVLQFIAEEEHIPSILELLYVSRFHEPAHY
jgi:hypothetical protein